jgi:hypothetical protein
MMTEMKEAYMPKPYPHSLLKPQIETSSSSNNIRMFEHSHWAHNPGINLNLSQKLKLQGNSKFNHLINILTLPLEAQHVKYLINK